ncbi:MAG: NADH-quinone oxidoreductase subunit N, partial [Actinobacteria bacterium]|nr:NADH-quinone oxidoreductase subunit N [Actinomycetota bacterium]
GKFYLVTAGAGAALWALIIVLVLTSTIGLYYYTRIVVAMWVRQPDENADGVGAAVGGGSAAVLAALTAFLIVFGVYPAPLIQLVERVVATLP